jgi:hypothetical protein
MPDKPPAGLEQPLLETREGPTLIPAGCQAFSSAYSSMAARCTANLTVFSFDSTDRRQ